MPRRVGVYARSHVLSLKQKKSLNYKKKSKKKYFRGKPKFVIAKHYLTPRLI